MVLYNMKKLINIGYIAALLFSGISYSKSDTQDFAGDDDLKSRVACEYGMQGKANGMTINQLLKALNAIQTISDDYKMVSLFCYSNYEQIKEDMKSEN